ncbi:MAG: hypothetical protein KAJ09_03925, partial [Deltaproteobacteria bacterium]|nr:hypothetical protein [Deltaproteobacteria bacterium]
MRNRNQVIAEQIRYKIDYVLSHLDRDPFSKTTGSFDRLFWGWKFKDYPDATLQRLIYPLAKYYYEIDSSLCEEELFLKWIINAFEYLEGIQHRDGSFDQAFPNEHSHGATAFLLHDSVRAYKIIQDKLKHAAKESILRTMQRMGDYLIKYDEEHGFISNHLLGAAAGLQVLYGLTGVDKYKNRAGFYINGVLSSQSPEGWYVEYGGADPSYQTLAVYYLAAYYQEKKDNNVLESLKNAIEFISYFIHPDGSFGGEYGSRNAEVFYPGGFALLHNEIPLARSILHFMIDKAKKGTTINLNSIDTGNLAPLLNNYLEVIRFNQENSSGDERDIPFQRGPFVKEFRDAGIVVCNGERNYAIIGISKGGVIKEFDKKDGVKLCDDCGYIGLLKTGKTITTQNLCEPTYNLSTDRLQLQVDFYEIKQSIPDPCRFLILRFFNLTVGKIRSIREAAKGFLVRALMTNSKKAPFKLIREILFTFPLKIRDRIEPEGCEDGFVYL